MSIRAHWMAIGLMTACLLMLVSCATIRDWFGRPGVEVPVTVVAVTVAPGTQMPFGPPTVPPCTALPAGMALTATVQSTNVMVEITGLQAGEYPTFQYLLAGSNRLSDGFEIFPGRPVGADGRAVDESWQRTHALGSVPEAWDIRVLHARGVACTRLVLPPA